MANQPRHQRLALGVDLVLDVDDGLAAIDRFDRALEHFELVAVDVDLDQLDLWQPEVIDGGAVNTPDAAVVVACRYFIDQHIGGETVLLDILREQVGIGTAGLERVNDAMLTDQLGHRDRERADIRADVDCHVARL